MVRKEVGREPKGGVDVGVVREDDTAEEEDDELVLALDKVFPVTVVAVVVIPGDDCFCCLSINIFAVFCIPTGPIRERKASRSACRRAISVLRSSDGLFVEDGFNSDTSEDTVPLVAVEVEFVLLLSTVESSLLFVFGKIREYFCLQTMVKEDNASFHVCICNLLLQFSKNNVCPRELTKRIKYSGLIGDVGDEVLLVDDEEDNHADGKVTAEVTAFPSCIPAISSIGIHPLSTGS